MFEKIMEGIVLEVVITFVCAGLYALITSGAEHTADAQFCSLIVTILWLFGTWVIVTVLVDAYKAEKRYIDRLYK